MEEEELKGGLLITPKDIQIITGNKLRAAQNEHLMVRDSLGKTTNRLTVEEYCLFNKLDYQKVLKYLNKHR